MIHTKNGRHNTRVAVEQPAASMPSQQDTVRRMEHEVGQWIRQNPLIGVSLAVLAGVGLGLLLKRRT
ncbi:MAG TPA: hypothetical protein VNQ76_09200 [Planctomicrobium sp.]|nr:hypothetical protein [Planctomicrobium sp.]